jgi:hypothetical protein
MHGRRWFVNVLFISHFYVKCCKYNKVGEDIRAVDCQKRWKGLRDKFVREIKKVKKKKSGDEGPAYVSCWPHFQAMMFVSDTIKHRTTTSNFGTEPSQEEDDTTDNPIDIEDSTCATCFNELDEPSSPGTASTNTTSSTTTTSISGSSAPSPTRKSSTPLAKSQAKKKKTRADEVDELLVKSLHSLQESKKAKIDDEEGHYGEQIAATLRRFTPRQKALAKMKIQELLFNIEFESEPVISPTYTHPPNPYYCQPY